MRLNQTQRHYILQAARNSFGEEVQVWLFGSRVDDARRGGDVDLYVETNTRFPVVTALRCKLSIEEKLDLHVDLLVNDRQQSNPIFSIAKSTGVQL